MNTGINVENNHYDRKLYRLECRLWGYAGHINTSRNMQAGKISPDPGEAEKHINFL